MASNKMYVLSLFVDDPELRTAYEGKISAHNNMVLTNSHPDSGFDLIVPDKATVCAESNILLDLSVKTAMVIINTDDAEPMITQSNLAKRPCGFYMYPRSSLGAKTKLRLANSVGIIDSGYRGNLKACLDNIHPREAHYIDKGDRLVQICAPDLTPFMVELVNSEEELSQTTRGTGGFGSTDNK